MANPKSKDGKSEKDKAKALYRSICACGNPNPEYVGFCTNCVQKMVIEYGEAADQYIPLSDKYDKLL